MTVTWQHALFAGKLLLGIGLLVALLFWKTDWRDVIAILGGARLKWIAPFIGISIALLWVSCYKWNRFIQAQGYCLSMPRLFGLYLVGMFFNNFLPSSVGGDVVRSYLVGRRIGSQSQAIAGVFLERITGFIALVSLSMGVICISPSLRKEPTVLIAIVGMSVVCLGILLILGSSQTQLWKWIPFRKQRIVQSIEAKAQKFQLAVVQFRKQPLLLAQAMLLSYLFYALAVLNVWIAGQFLGIRCELAPLVLVTPLIMLLASLPLTPNSIGVWEWGFSYFLTAAGATPAEGLAVALALRGKDLLFSLVGGIVFLLNRSPAVSEINAELRHRA